MGPAGRVLQREHGVHEIVSRVEALASDGPLPDLTSTSMFIAAETRAFGIARTMSPHTRDRADAAIVFAADALVTMLIEQADKGLADLVYLANSVAAVPGLSDATPPF